MTMIKSDKLIIGAGLYGLYAALYLAKKNRDEKIIVIEKDKESFSRATYINQARIHNGYHYPRSITTAEKSANYFSRFINDFSFCILKDFKQIYAISSDFSWTSADQFKKFCKDANIMCEEVNVEKYFKEGMCDGAFLTEEYTYDAMLLKKHFLHELSKYNNVNIIYETKITSIKKTNQIFKINVANGDEYQGPFLLNATYASVNQIASYLGYEQFKIKYELCEIILCDVDDRLKKIGITVMDGPFFSIMPFGKTGMHSLTSVTFTPHKTCYDSLPVFKCQEKSNGNCSSTELNNCNICNEKPKSSWVYMSNLAKKYLLDKYMFEYNRSLFSMKPILKSSEVDDSRPTVIREYGEIPKYISVLSGKINTVYDLDEVLDNV